MSTLTVTLVQTDLHWEDPAGNRRELGEKIRSLSQKTEIVVLPEMFTTGFSMEAARLAEPMDGASVAWMREIAAEKKIILTGSLIIKEGGHNYNRLVWMLPNGQYGCYDKRHRFAYGGEGEQYTPGVKRLIASVKGWKINLQVCYDLRFPVWARNSLDEQGQPEYDVLVYVANWPEPRIQAWKTLLTARAIENQCYVIGVNRTGKDGSGHQYTGDSMVIDPLGEVIYHKAGQEDTPTIALDKARLEEVRGKLPFLGDADAFHISI
jgi:predicted amidohydrolase